MNYLPPEQMQTSDLQNVEDLLESKLLIVTIGSNDVENTYLS